MPSAVVVGSGPNGLAAALQLARHGVAVTVVEAALELGGGVRSRQDPEFGVTHDHCSAFHPLGAASPVWARLGLEKQGLGWAWAEIDCAHPLQGAPGAASFRDIEATARHLGQDGATWRRLMAHPLAHAPAMALPATAVGKAFRTARARALFAGMAAHSFAPLSQPFTSGVAITLAAAGHRWGWPVAVGGSQSIAAALIAGCGTHGVRFELEHTVTHARELSGYDLILLDLNPRQVHDIYGDELPRRIRNSYGRYRMGSAAFKVDFVLEGDIPWADPYARRAGTVHLGGTAEEIAFAERARARSRFINPPFTLVGQQYLADPSRSRDGYNPIYAYAHVPLGMKRDITAEIIAHIERYAPGFRSRIVKAQTAGPHALQLHNHSFTGGDILGGANTGAQMLLRPRPSLNPYATGIPGVYICSQSTPPGPGVHGVNGFVAASLALRRVGR